MYEDLDPEILDCCQVLEYSFNPSNNRYQNYIRPYWFNKFPLSLKNEQKQAEILLIGYTDKGDPDFITELHPTASKYLFYGTDEGNKPKNKSFILFYFQPDTKELTCLFYNNFTPSEEIKQQLIETAIEIIKTQSH